jgi:lipopolysaccharide export system permease protein
MRIIDRYVIISFLRNYVISFLVLVGMYVVMDMVFNFNHMVDVQSGTGGEAQGIFGALYDIFDFYFYQCFLIFVQLSGIIPVVAAAFTLMRFSRFNELTAMLAAGVPLLRIAAPIILVSVVLNGLLLIDQEMILPLMIPKIMRDHDEVHKGPRGYYAIEAMQDAGGGLVYAARYFPTPGDKQPYMLDLDVIERQSARRTISGETREVMIPVAHLQAQEAHWNPDTQQWDLLNGVRTSGLNTSHLVNEKVATFKSNITPEEIALYRSGNFVDLLPTSRIDQLLTRPNMYGKMALLRVKHWRFTQPLMNVTLLLLAIPCVMTREPGKLKTAATKTLFLMGLAMGSVFIFQKIAGDIPQGIANTASGPSTWAMVMAWGPIFIFGPLSVFLLDRIKT